MARFMDVNIALGGEGRETDMVEAAGLAVKLGYETICFNNFTETLSVKTGKKDQGKVAPIQSADNYRLKEDKLSQLQLQYKGQRRVEQLTRFTTVLSDPAQVVRLQNDEIIQSYDLLAVEPTTEKLFLTACKDLPIDIISLDLTQRLPFLPKRTAIGCALERGVMFEIRYAPMLRDSSGSTGMSSSRRYVISNGNTLVNICQSKNIIISSGAITAMELRGPLDVCNLALLFGITEARARACLTSNCRAAVMHAAARKSSRGLLSICRVSAVQSKDLWKIPQTSPQKLHNSAVDQKSADSAAVSCDARSAATVDKVAGSAGTSAVHSSAAIEATAAVNSVVVDKSGHTQIFNVNLKTAVTPAGVSSEEQKLDTVAETWNHIDLESNGSTLERTSNKRKPDRTDTIDAAVVKKKKKNKNKILNVSNASDNDTNHVNNCNNVITSNNNLDKR